MTCLEFARLSEATQLAAAWRGQARSTLHQPRSAYVAQLGSDHFTSDSWKPLEHMILIWNWHLFCSESDGAWLLHMVLARCSLFDGWYFTFWLLASFAYSRMQICVWIYVVCVDFKFQTCIDRAMDCARTIAHNLHMFGFIFHVNGKLLEYLRVLMRVVLMRLYICISWCS